MTKTYTLPITCSNLMLIGFIILHVLVIIATVIFYIEKNPPILITFILMGWNVLGGIWLLLFITSGIANKFPKIKCKCDEDNDNE